MSEMKVQIYVNGKPVGEGVDLMNERAGAIDWSKIFQQLIQQLLQNIDWGKVIAAILETILRGAEYDAPKVPPSSGVKINC